MSRQDEASSEPEREDTDVIGARIGAQVVDSIAMTAILLLPIFLFGNLGSGEASSGGLAMVGILIGLGGAFFYHFLLEGYWGGQTVGKRLFGIKVVKEDGGPCDYAGAFVRNLLEMLDGLFYYLIGFVAMAISDKRQRIGDRLAGTVVVKED